jgi:acyl transferase domain-containing protein
MAPPTDSAGTGPVFMVPGQGSGGDPRGALTELYRRAPTLRDLVDALLKDMQQAAEAADPACMLNMPTVSDILLAEDPNIPLRHGLRQITEYALSVTMHHILTAYGVRPKAVFGHSFGEIAALVCAGVFDVADGVRAVCALNAECESIVGQGAMVLFEAGEEDAQRLLHTVGHPDLVLACINTPYETIVSGTAEAITELFRQADTKGPRLIKLPVPYASHHPRLAAVADRFCGRLRALPQRQLRLPVHSPVQGGDYEDTDDLHRALADLLIKPVRLPDTLLTLDERGFGPFIELGPSNSLCRCVRETLPTADVIAPLSDNQSWLVTDQADSPPQLLT